MRKRKAHLVKMPAGKDEVPQTPEVRVEMDPQVPIDLPRSIEFSYSKSAFLQKLVLQTIMMMLVIVILSPFFLDIKLLYSAIILGTLGAYMVISSISPLLTTHTLTPEKLVLRQGWYFRTTISVEDIESVETTDEPSKVGVKFSIAYRKVYVTGSRFGLVKITLKEPMRFPMVMGKRAEEVIIDVDDPSKFVEVLNGFIQQRDAPILASPIQWS
jgi:hypothetical protein